MHHARALVLVCCALATSVACAHYYPDPEKAQVAETTSATMVTEPQPSIDDMAARFAGQICDREVQCHADPSRAEPCLRTYLGRARVELATWKCSPAGTRARLKECLTAIHAEPCAVDLSSRRTLCETNEACPDPAAHIVSPGRVLADAGP